MTCKNYRRIRQVRINAKQDNRTVCLDGFDHLSYVFKSWKSNGAISFDVKLLRDGVTF